MLDYLLLAPLVEGSVVITMETVPRSPADFLFAGSQKLTPPNYGADLPHDGLTIE